MRPSSLGGGRILRRTLSVRLSVCLSVCPSVHLSVRPVIERHVAPPSELQWHTCTFRQRAAYRTAISAAQILVITVKVFNDDTVRRALSLRQLCSASSAYWFYIWAINYSYATTRQKKSKTEPRFYIYTEQTSLPQSQVWSWDCRRWSDKRLLGMMDRWRYVKIDR